MPRRPAVTFLRCPDCGVAFLEDLTPPDYEHDMVEMLDYYVEQGAGIDLIVAPLQRIPPETVRRCLDVGGAFGFALDFGRHAFGWEVLEVDPSPLAAAGGEALGLPVRRAYFNRDLDLGPEPFDLVVCSEVLEHVAEPHALLGAIRDRLSPQGLLVLSTPNLDLVRPEAEAGALGRALSAGLHLVLYDLRSLGTVLERAGFAAVRIEESPETLRVFAALDPAVLARIRPADPERERARLRDYFGARAESSPPGSSLACGFAYRHFKECINAGMHREGASSLARLARIYRDRYGLDLEILTPEGVSAPPQIPYNLTGALFYAGILELNGFDRPDRAARAFAASIAAGERLQGRQNPFGLCDGETEALIVQSLRHLPMAEARVAPAEAGAPGPAGGPAPAAPDPEDPGGWPGGRRPPSPGEGWAGRILSRLRSGRPLLIAERFVSPPAGLDQIVLPLDVVARNRPARLRVVIVKEEGGPEVRVATFSSLGLSPGESLRLDFAPFDAPARTPFLLGVLDLSGETEPPLAADLRALRAGAAGRRPIYLQCGGGGARAASGHLADERAIAVFRLPPEGGGGSSEGGRPREPAAEEREGVRPAAGRGGVDVAYWLDSFWCDPHGIYLRGWVHAHGHRVRALTVEAGGRSVRFERFTDRPDLLKHYPDHEHVRHAGFAVYLPCPPGHPVRWSLETDGGPASLPLPLPEGPLPAWPAAPDGEDDSDLESPMLRRFVDLANAREGRVLQIGARTPVGLEGMPPRSSLRCRVIGLDIHPGHCVDLVGDAHFLSHFLRPASFDAVISGSVLEHLQAPWLFAAEVNRILKPGGLVYHEAPGAWPAHSQPNDFWRMSADGLAALFGAECGFEVLEARDGGPMAMVPSPQWRERHLDMPTVPAFAMAEILARKAAEIEPGAVAWPLRAAASAERSRRYPVDGLRVAQPPREGAP